MTYTPVTHEALARLKKRLKATFSVDELQYLRRLNPLQARIKGEDILIKRGVFDKGYEW